MHDTTMARLDPAWKPWSVPRVNKRPNSAQAIAGVSLIERLIAWRRPTAFQRCLAIHILNTTESVNDAAPAIDAA
ncbi:MAG TPA: hypothetical protein VGR52_02125 [Stellaceae bacterium]|nr:hypothetical protein [Stellaceae bacterium]